MKHRNLDLAPPPTRPMDSTREIGTDYQPLSTYTPPTPITDFNRAIWRPRLCLVSYETLWGKQCPSAKRINHGRGRPSIHRRGLRSLAMRGVQQHSQLPKELGNWKKGNGANLTHD